eukprot:Filipodium_phascolosomae@DN8130_c0_g1_i1.p1
MEERTFIMAKPEAVQRGIVAKIIERFEQRGFKLVAMKMVKPSLEHIQKHYAELSEKGFYAQLCTYMSSGPVVAMVWEGKSVVATGRKMLGATNPLDSTPGTIRGDFAVETGRNICHGSDSVQSAKREITHWFTEAELCPWEPLLNKAVYEV